MTRYHEILWMVVVGGLFACTSNDSKSTLKNGGSAGIGEGPDVGASGSGEDANLGGHAGLGGSGGWAVVPDGGQAGLGGSAGGAAGAVDPGPPGGPVDIPGVYNARDTGGLPTSSGKRIRRHHLIRAGHLADISTPGCQRLSDLKIRTVVDLREASDLTTQPDASCVAAKSAYFLEDLPKILPPSAAAYEQTLNAAEPKLAAIFTHLSANDALPAIVHCVIGRDRASLITAILLLSLGVSTDQVSDDFVSNQDPTVQVDAAWLEPMFDRVAAAGGIEAYLQKHGVTLEMIEKFRVMALE